MRRRATLDLDLLDKRDFSPVGYQRINKKSGRKTERDDIVKGYQYRQGEYVVRTATRIATTCLSASRKR